MITSPIYMAEESRCRHGKKVALAWHSASFGQIFRPQPLDNFRHEALHWRPGTETAGGIDELQCSAFPNYRLEPHIFQGCSCYKSVINANYASDDALE